MKLVPLLTALNSNPSTGKSSSSKY